MDNKELMKNTPQFNTIEDMERHYYGSIVGQDLQKTAYGTGTSGGFNGIFGPKLWYQVNTKRSVFASLQKRPYQKWGYRAITGRAYTDTSGLSSEAASIPTAAVLSFSEISVELKEISESFEQSARVAATVGKDDTPTWEELRGAMSTDFEKRINEALVGDMDTAASTWYEFETLERIISSDAETDNDSGIGDGDEDIYGLTRHGNDWTDAYVNENSATTRTLTLPLIDTLEENCRPYWSDSSSTDAVYYTGFDTLYAWSRLLQPNQRFDNEKFSASVNGVKAVGHNEAGFTTATYNGLPIIPSNDIQTRGSGGTPLRQIMLVQPEFTHIAVAKPLLYMESEEYQHIGKFARQGVFYMIGETTCTLFKANGKLRDIKK